ncbi:hypothetical protein FE633_13610 [Streptomyces montanus]|uniref:Uncharacterized protein n=1 Tax=Streptomyces montanus TaxID=2580423 RepID=A0A5R9FT01_9ACTN|nr:hypothetical protein [Streptomyces montanus]TLS45789.1 hypothetical protein FE633_13610 [Streptomyces montanus]
MPVPIPCRACHGGHYQPESPGSFHCGSCGSPATESTFRLQSDERLIVHAGVLQILTVPEGHQVITPDRRCHAPHLGASLTLALRLNRTHPVFRQTEDIQTAESLLAALDADERGPWVLSPAQLGVLTRAMDVRNALLPSASRRHPDFDAEIRAAHTRSRHPRAT